MRRADHATPAPTGGSLWVWEYGTPRCIVPILSWVHDQFSDQDRSGNSQREQTIRSPGRPRPDHCLGCCVDRASHKVRLTARFDLIGRLRLAVRANGSSGSLERSVGSLRHTKATVIDKVRRLDPGLRLKCIGDALEAGVLSLRYAREEKIHIKPGLLSSKAFPGLSRL